MPFIFIYENTLHVFVVSCIIEFNFWSLNPPSCWEFGDKYNHLICTQVLSDLLISFIFISSILPILLFYSLEVRVTNQTKFTVIGYTTKLKADQMGNMLTNLPWPLLIKSIIYHLLVFEYDFNDSCIITNKKLC